MSWITTAKECLVNRKLYGQWHTVAFSGTIANPKQVTIMDQEMYIYPDIPPTPLQKSNISLVITYLLP